MDRTKIAAVVMVVLLAGGVAVPHAATGPDSGCPDGDNCNRDGGHGRSASVGWR